MRIKKAFYYSFFFVAAILLFVSIRNTVIWTKDFYGLKTLTSLSDEELSYNPLSKDFFWISPSVALHILKTQEYPYKNCADISLILDSCGEPKIEYTGRSLGIVSKEAELRLFELIEYLIERGEPIDAYSSQGYTALQSAILGNEPKLVGLLLNAGANPYLPIKSETSVFGKNSIEFLDILIGKNKADFTQVRELIDKYLPNHEMQLTPEGAH